MFVKKLSDFIYLIDLRPGGLEKFIASYVVVGHETAIVETGPTSTVNNLLVGLREIGVAKKHVKYVAVSHIHLDHGGGAGTLLHHLPNAKLIVHPRGVHHMASPERLWVQSRNALGEVAELYGKVESVPRQRIVAANDGMLIDLGEGVELKVLETLGHASHHLSFYEARSQGIFTGDAAGVYIPDFKAVIPTTPAPFHLDKALTSISKLQKMSPKQLYYTHFGPANHAMERLKNYAEQLKIWANIVQEGIQNGKSYRNIREQIFEKDISLRNALDFVKAHPILERSVLTQSIKGFIGYLER